MSQTHSCLQALRTELSYLEGGDAVAQAYAVHYLTQAVAVAGLFFPKSIIARPQPTAGTASITLGFASGYSLQVTPPYLHAEQPGVAKIFLLLFHHNRL